MMIMKWRSVQTNEYDLQAQTYPIINTHHKLHSNCEKQNPCFPGMYLQWMTEYDVANISVTQGV